jgi:putative lipoprotein
MKRLMFLGSLCGVVALLASCGNATTTTNNTDTTDTAAVEQTVAAMPAMPMMEAQPVSYEDTIPAADCPGILMKVTFNNPDGTYTMSTLYLERDEQPEVVSGIVKVLDSAAMTFALCPQDTTLQTYQFKVEQDAIRMLDSEGQEITGDIADKYLLKKVAM